MNWKLNWKPLFAGLLAAGLLSGCAAGAGPVQTLPAIDPQPAPTETARNVTVNSVRELTDAIAPGAVITLPEGLLKLDPGEDPVVGALRELKEETGAEPETFLPLGRIIPAPGCYGEILHLFLAKGLKFSEQHLDPDEFLNVERVPFDEMVHRCMNGEIDDAKTVAAVLRAKVLLNL